MAARRHALGGKGEAPGGGVQYCQIAHWLEAKQPDLLRAFRNTCLDMKLRPRGGDPPVTLLVPDKAFLKEILAALDEDTAKARSYLGSLVLLEHFGSSEDFVQAEGEAPARPAGTLNRTRYEVKVDGRKVRLNGAELEAEPGFRPTPELEERVAVWRLKEKPPLPSKPFEVAPRAARPPRRADKAGGGEPAGAEARRGLAERVLAAAVGGAGPNPWLVATLAVLAELEAHEAELYRAVVPLLDYNPVISFYLLVQPYCAEPGRLLLPDAVFASEAVCPPGGGVPHTYTGDPVEAFKAHFRPWWGGAREWASGEAKDVQACCNRLAADRDRARVEASSCASPQEVGAVVLRHYDSLVASGLLHGHEAHLPEGTRALLAGASAGGLRGRAGGPDGAGSSPGLFKLHQDELRFRLRVAMQEVAAGTARGAPLGPLLGEFVVALVEDHMPGNLLRQELTHALPPAADPREVPRDASDTAKVALFVNSTDLLYLSVPPACVGEVWGGRPDSLGEVPFNSHRSGLDALVERPPARGGGGFARRRAQITGGGGVGAAGVRDRLSDGALAELRARLAACGGRLPPEVEALLHGAPGGE